ncbi:MAG: hypothetical protein FIA92_10620 [Chloroflexi bacterium]|nr:hypothetical protein [Chloroflexota bacterium]
MAIRTYAVPPTPVLHHDGRAYVLLGTLMIIVLTAVAAWGVVRPTPRSVTVPLAGAEAISASALAYTVLCPSHANTREQRQELARIHNALVTLPERASPLHRIVAYPSGFSPTYDPLAPCHRLFPGPP